MLDTLFNRDNDNKAAKLSAALMAKLSADDIADLVATANANGLQSKNADIALENALLKHAKAMLKAAPEVTAENVTKQTLINALTTELSKKTKGESRGL